MVSCVTARIFSAGPSNTAGSTLPCKAIFEPKDLRISVRSTRQSTLKTFAPHCATAGSKWWDAFV